MAPKRFSQLRRFFVPPPYVWSPSNLSGTGAVLRRDSEQAALTESKELTRFLADIGVRGGSRRKGSAGGDSENHSLSTFPMSKLLYFTSLFK